MSENGHEGNEFPAVKELARAPRRVLGVLVEKALTTPEYYPMTLKALTNGCNQKSNRDPVTNYSEEFVLDTLEELREKGLAGVVHTESGRTERYRHYMRHRFTLSEPQLAILTELFLRGRQQLGELRSRASRMVEIADREQLRQELRGLLEMGFLEAGGPLEQRGVSVDHTFYTEKERAKRGSEAKEPAVAERPTQPAESTPDRQQRLADLEAKQEELRLENQGLREELQSLKEEFRQLADRVDRLHRDLGG